MKPAALLRHHSVAWFRRMVGAVGQLELSVLVAAAVIVVGSWGFIVLAGLMAGGDTQHFDERVMLSLRRAEDLRVPVGPAWIRTAAVDITALGGNTVLAMLTITVAGYILLHKRYGALVLLIVSACGGAMINSTLKHAFGRQRPTIVPALIPVMSHSFPSGHAMASAAIYLSLAVLLAALTPRKRDRAYILGVALTVTFAIGVTRVYLGVHYPSDVLAGWTAGIVWALFCWLAVRTAPRVLERLSRQS